MRNLKKCLLLVLLTGTSGVAIQAQSEEPILVRPVDEEVHQTTNRLLAAYQNYVSSPGNNASDDLSAVHDLLLESFVRTDTLQASLLNKKLELERRQSGLTLRSSFSTQSALDVQQEELALASNTPLARVGVEWDVLNSGWLGTNEGAQAAALERELFQYQREQQLEQDNYSHRYQHITRQFDRHKAILLERREQLLARALQILEGLYHTHQLPYEQVLDYRRRLKESRLLATTYRHFVAQGAPAPVVDVSALPVLDIAIDELLPAAAQNPHLNDILRVKKKQAELDYAVAPAWQLRASLNYNYGFGGQRFPAIGVNLRAPLATSTQTRRALIRTSQDLIEQKAEQAQYQVERQVLNLYQEYAFLQKQYLNQIHTLVGGQEQIRIQRTLRERKQAAPVSPLPLLQLYDEQLAGQIDLLDLKQQMYLCLLRIHTLCPQIDLYQVLQPVSFSHITHKVAGQRLLLFSPVDLTRFNSAAFYLAYLRKNELQTILLQRDEVADWLPYFREKGFSVWIPEGMGKVWQQQAQGTYQLVAGAIALQLSGRPRASGYPCLTVDPASFSSRYALEQWITGQHNRREEAFFLFRGAAALYTQEWQALQNLSQNIQR